MNEFTLCDELVLVLDPAIVEVAAKQLAQRWWWDESDEERAEITLTAALPFIEQQIREQIAAEIEGMAREVLNRDTSTSLDRDHNQSEADQLRAIAARITRTRKDT